MKRIKTKKSSNHILNLQKFNFKILYRFINWISIGHRVYLNVSYTVAALLFEKFCKMT